MLSPADASRASGRARERELEQKARAGDLERQLAEIKRQAQPMATPLGIETPAMEILRAKLVQENRRSILLKRDNELLMEHCRQMEERQRQAALGDRPHGDIRAMKRTRSERARKVRSAIGRPRDARKG